MEGYTVIAEELREQFASRNTWPTHVFLQAGVGSFAAALTDQIRQTWDIQPIIVVVEPEAAQCLGASYRSGQVTQVTGPVSNMGRLDCKAPSFMALKILTDADTHFVSVSDIQAEIAANKLLSLGIPTTPSGAAGFAALAQIPTDQQSMTPLVIATEGPVN
jgi:diaminopropionate ammonia-lyase